MEQNKYNIYNLNIKTIKGNRLVDTLESNDAVKVVNFLKKTIHNEALERLDAYYGQGDECYISVYAEKTCSFVIIHDAALGKSYNFSNKKYANDKTEVELAGYYFPQMCICEDQDILIDIIIHFFETGKMNKDYEWFEFDEG